MQPGDPDPFDLRDPESLAKLGRRNADPVPLRRIVDQESKPDAPAASVPHEIAQLIERVDVQGDMPREQVIEVGAAQIRPAVDDVLGGHAGGEGGEGVAWRVRVHARPELVEPPDDERVLVADECVVALQRAVRERLDEAEVAPLDLTEVVDVERAAEAPEKRFGLFNHRRSPRAWHAPGDGDRGVAPRHRRPDAASDPAPVPRRGGGTRGSSSRRGEPRRDP